MTSVALMMAKKTIFALAVLLLLMLLLPPAVLVFDEDLSLGLASAEIEEPVAVGGQGTATGTALGSGWR